MATPSDLYSDIVDALAALTPQPTTALISGMQLTQYTPTGSGQWAFVRVIESETQPVGSNERVTFAQAEIEAVFRAPGRTPTALNAAESTSRLYFAQIANPEFWWEMPSVRRTQTAPEITFPTSAERVGSIVRYTVGALVALEA